MNVHTDAGAGGRVGLQIGQGMYLLYLNGSIRVSLPFIWFAIVVRSAVITTVDCSCSYGVIPLSDKY